MIKKNISLSYINFIILIYGFVFLALIQNCEYRINNLSQKEIFANSGGLSLINDSDRSSQISGGVHVDKDNFADRGGLTKDGDVDVKVAKDGNNENNNSTNTQNSNNKQTRKARIFVTNRMFYGGFAPYYSKGGVSTADKACNDPNETAKPVGSEKYKALIGEVGVRVICVRSFCVRNNISIDSPLQANTTYLRSDGVTPIGETNEAGIFDDNLLNSFENTANTDRFKVYWTGLKRDWTVNDRANCKNFSTNSQYQIGSASDTLNSTFYNDVHNVLESEDKLCSVKHALVCVEQN